MSVFGKPAMTWGYNEVLDMPEADREYYVAQLYKVTESVTKKT